MSAQSWHQKKIYRLPVPCVSLNKIYSSRIAYTLIKHHTHLILPHYYPLILIFCYNSEMAEHQWWDLSPTFSVFVPELINQFVTIYTLIRFSNSWSIGSIININPSEQQGAYCPSPPYSSCNSKSMTIAITFFLPSTVHLPSISSL